MPAAQAIASWTHAVLRHFCLTGHLHRDKGSLQRAEAHVLYSCNRHFTLLEGKCCSHDDLAHLLPCAASCWWRLLGWRSHLHVIVRVFTLKAVPSANRSSLQRQADASGIAHGSLTVHRELEAGTQQVSPVSRITRLCDADLTAFPISGCPCCQLLSLYGGPTSATGPR